MNPEQEQIIMESLERNETADVLLSTASPSDIPEIIEIERSVSGHKTYSSMTTPEEWLQMFKKVKTFLIKGSNGDVVGAVSYEVKDSSHAYIDGLAIRPEFQGKGFARKAMDIVMEELKDFQKIDLVTHPENRRAIELYQSLGFKIEKEIENYFGDGEPRVIMIKQR